MVFFPPGKSNVFLWNFEKALLEILMRSSIFCLCVLVPFYLEILMCSYKRIMLYFIQIIAIVWFFSVACVSIIYCIARFKLSNVEKYNNMIFPISSYTATVIFFICYTIIYKVVKNSSNSSIGKSKSTYKKPSGKTTNSNDGSEKGSLKQEVCLHIKIPLMI